MTAEQITELAQLRNRIDRAYRAAGNHPALYGPSWWHLERLEALEANLPTDPAQRATVEAQIKAQVNEMERQQWEAALKRFRSHAPRVRT